MTSASNLDAAGRWRAELAAWVIPEHILAAATESPYGFPVGLFAADDEPADDPSRRRALQALPPQGTVLDVGCGGGRASMALVPPAGTVVGVDSSPAMLASYARAAEIRGVGHAEVAGSWPDVAGRVGRADVVLAHHVAYNVADLPSFATALAVAARHRVVLELTDVHPWVTTNPLWVRFHDLTRPSGPSATLAAEVLADLGLDVRAERWQRPQRRGSRTDLVAFVRRRLCLPAASDPLVDAALPADYEFAARDVTTLWWDVPQPPEGRCRPALTRDAGGTIPRQQFEPRREPAEQRPTSTDSGKSASRWARGPSAASGESTNGEAPVS